MFSSNLAIYKLLRAIGLSLSKSESVKAFSSTIQFLGKGAGNFTQNVKSYVKIGNVLAAV